MAEDDFGRVLVGCILLTMLMLVLSIDATDVEVVARATAVRNWSESAAHWAVWLWPAEV